ncbi:MAG: hypothetical protein JWR35_2077 [Marmoricola sp.]|nr:hypothetical protein [Marmoricola sp.]
MGSQLAPSRPIALLDRAINYTRGCLALVAETELSAPTPCARWDLQALLEHMNDSLAAFTEAAEIGYVDLAPVRGLPEADRLVESLKLRACVALGAWTSRITCAPIGVGDAALGEGPLAAVGALEISVHGWDVAQACGIDRPIPEDLAAHLYDVALDLVTTADRPHRFANPIDPADLDDPSASTRLLAHLGRSG